MYGYSGYLKVLKVERCSSKNAVCYRCREKVFGEPIWVVVGYQTAYPFCKDCSRLLGLEDVRLSRELSKEREIETNVVKSWYGREQ